MRRSHYQSRAVWICFVAATAIALTGAVQVAAASDSFASTPKPFTLTKVTPDPVVLKIKSTPGSTTKEVKIHWKGTATFPLTLTVTPEPGCTTSNFTCNSSSQTYTSGTHTLVRNSVCSIPTAGSGSHTGTWDYQLVDANGQTTAAVPVTETCSWS